MLIPCNRATLHDHHVPEASGYFLQLIREEVAQGLQCSVKQQRLLYSAVTTHFEKITHFEKKFQSALKFEQLQRTLNFFFSNCVNS
jgi:hypothetical protein